MFGFGGTRGFQLGVVLEAKNLLKAEMGRVKADTDVAKAKLAGLQGQLRQLERYSRGMKIGAGITAAGAGLSILSVKLVDANKQIEEAVGTVGLAAASTNAEWVRMEPRVRKTLERLTIEHRGTAEDVSNAWYRMASIGIDVDTFEESADTILWANTAMRGNAEDTAKAVGMAYSNFGKNLPGKTEGDKIKYVADMFARITQISPETGPALALGMRYAIAPMKTWAMSLEEGVATLGLLSKQGLEAEMAGTALMATHRQLLEAEDKLNLQFKKNADGTYAFANVIEALHKKYGDNIADNKKAKAAIADAFGDEGSRAIMALWGMEDALRATTKEMKNSKGSAEDMAKALEGTSGAKLERLSDSWTIFKGSLMKDNKVVDHAVDQLTKLMDALNELPDWARTLVGTGMAVGGVAGSVAGPAMTGYSMLMQYRLAKGIKGLAGTGGLGAAPVYETNPAAMGGGGVAGAAAKKGGVLGKVGRYAGWAGVGGLAAYATGKATGGLPMGGGKTYHEELTKMLGGHETLAYLLGGTTPGMAMAAGKGVYESGKKVVERAGDVNISGGINITTQAKDANSIAAEIAAAIKRQVKRTGARQSP